MDNSFKSRSSLTVDDKTYEIFKLDTFVPKYKVSRLPYSLMMLLENLLRNKYGDLSRWSHFVPSAPTHERCLFLW